MNQLKIAALAAALSGFLVTVGAAGEQKNTTGLPTYPHDAGGIMLATFQSYPNGQHCISYMSNTTDALSIVENWYKRQLPNAKVDDINHNSMYGSYFTLNGIKLLSGNDVVNIYADTDSHKTTIDIFKCRDAVPAGN